MWKKELALPITFPKLKVHIIKWRTRGRVRTQQKFLFPQWDRSRGTLRVNDPASTKHLLTPAGTGRIMAPSKCTLDELSPAGQEDQHILM